MLKAFKTLGQSLLSLFKSNVKVAVPAIEQTEGYEDALHEETTSILDKLSKGIIENKYPNIKIVIDPGHGSKGKKPDPGAFGIVDGKYVVECDLVLEIAIRLAYILEKSGMKVILTRIDCEAPSTLADKARVIKAENPDLMLSIHLNSNVGTPAEGIETLYSAQKPGSKEFARSIQKAMVEAFPTHKDRGIKNGEKLYILKAHPVEACALIECEFINNPTQAAFIVNNYDEIAIALAKGIYSFLDR